MHPDAWLVVIDPQRIFADPSSPWGSPMFPDIVEPVRRLAAARRVADRRHPVGRPTAPAGQLGGIPPRRGPSPTSRPTTRCSTLVDELPDLAHRPPPW